MADHRHKRETTARRTPRAVVIAGPLALLATASVVTLGVLAAGPAPSPGDVAAAPAPAAGASALERRDVVSRSEARATPSAAPSSAATQEPTAGPTATVTRIPSKAELMLAKGATRKAVAKADTRQWTTDALNLWDQPGDKATQVGEIEAGQKVLVTGRHLYGRDELVVDGASRWVTSGYLSDDEPLGVGAGLSDAPCPDGSVESGLVSDAVLVYRSVCNAFPQITSYGGWDAHGEHSSGRALDIMTSDVALGTAIAEFLQAHASELNLYDVIWRQHIWTPVRSSEGWRSMPSRGSATADHYDHVHVAVN